MTPDHELNTVILVISETSSKTCFIKYN